MPESQSAPSPSPTETFTPRDAAFAGSEILHAHGRPWGATVAMLMALFVPLITLTVAALVVPFRVGNEVMAKVFSGWVHWMPIYSSMPVPQPFPVGVAVNVAAALAWLVAVLFLLHWAYLAVCIRLWRLMNGRTDDFRRETAFAWRQALAAWPAMLTLIALPTAFGIAAVAQGTMGIMRVNFPPAWVASTAVLVVTGLGALLWLSAWPIWGFVVAEQPRLRGRRLMREIDLAQRPAANALVATVFFFLLRLAVVSLVFGLLGKAIDRQIGDATTAGWFAAVIVVILLPFDCAAMMARVAAIYRHSRHRLTGVVVLGRAVMDDSATSFADGPAGVAGFGSLAAEPMAGPRVGRFVLRWVFVCVALIGGAMLAGYTFLWAPIDFDHTFIAAMRERFEPPKLTANSATAEFRVIEAQMIRAMRDDSAVRAFDQSMPADVASVNAGPIARARKILAANPEWLTRWRATHDRDDSRSHVRSGSVASAPWAPAFVRLAKLRLVAALDDPAEFPLAVRDVARLVVFFTHNGTIAEYEIAHTIFGTLEAAIGEHFGRCRAAHLSAIDAALARIETQMQNPEAAVIREILRNPSPMGLRMAEPSLRAFDFKFRLGNAEWLADDMADRIRNPQGILPRALGEFRLRYMWTHLHVYDPTGKFDVAAMRQMRTRTRLLRVACRVEAAHLAGGEWPASLADVPANPWPTDVPFSFADDWAFAGEYRFRGRLGEFRRDWLLPSPMFSPLELGYAIETSGEISGPTVRLFVRY